MIRWHGYIVIQFLPGLSEAHRQTLIARIDRIESVGKASHQLLQKRTSLDGLFVLYECDFPAHAVEFDFIAGWLVDLFEVDPALVTYTTGTLTIFNRLSCFATYKYGGVNRLRVGLLGCESDAVLCSRAESGAEADYYVNVAHGAEWNLTP